MKVRLVNIPVSVPSTFPGKVYISVSVDGLSKTIEVPKGTSGNQTYEFNFSWGSETKSLIVIQVYDSLGLKSNIFQIPLPTVSLTANKGTNEVYFRADLGVNYTSFSKMRFILGATAIKTDGSSVDLRPLQFIAYSNGDVEIYKWDANSRTFTYVTKYNKPYVLYRFGLAYSSSYGRNVIANYVRVFSSTGSWNDIYSWREDYGGDSELSGLRYDNVSGLYVSTWMDYLVNTSYPFSIQLQSRVYYTYKYV